MDAPSTLTLEQRHALNVSLDAQLKKAEYIYDLLLLLEAYHKIACLCWQHPYEKRRECARGLTKGTKAHSGCLAERSIRAYIFQETGIQHNYTVKLKEKDGYVQRLAHTWRRESVDGSWVSLWESVADRKLQDVFDDWEWAKANRDFRKGGLRKMLLRREFIQDSRALRMGGAFRRVSNIRGVRGGYFCPALTRSFEKLTPPAEEVYPWATAMAMAARCRANLSGGTE